MDWSFFAWGQWDCFCEHCDEHFVPQKEEGIFWLYEKVSFLSTLLYITQFINTYIDPVCPDRLTLRYCSCNTYLLHRRAELKAAPRSTCLMGNCTLGNNEPLEVPTYIFGESYLVLLKTNEKIDLWLIWQIGLCYEYYLCVFFYNLPSISYRGVPV